MVEWTPLVLTALFSALASGVGAFFAFRVGLERRLTAVETILQQHPPSALRGDLQEVQRSLERMKYESDQLAPVNEFLAKSALASLQRMLRGDDP